MGISKIGGKEQGENARKNLSVLWLQGRNSSISILLYGNIYVDTFKVDKEISTKKGGSEVRYLLLNGSLIDSGCVKRGVGSAAYSRNINGFATQ